MRATLESLRGTGSADEPASEVTRVQPVCRSSQEVPVGALEYHIFTPQRARDPLLEDAYEVWRSVWLAAFESVHGVYRLHSDQFVRQDQIAVISAGGRCISLMGLRCLDLSLARVRDDSYFEPWPDEVLASLDDSIVGVTSNLAVHPDWRGAVVTSPLAPGSSARLSSVMIALSVRSSFASSVQSVIALTRNNRSVDKLASSLGAAKLGQITLHGADADIVRFDRANALTRGGVIDELWERRHQG
jgi:hypothetical protein